MRRASGCFHKAGINIETYPVGKIAGPRKYNIDHLLVPHVRSLVYWDILIHEMAGYMAYKLADTFDLLTWAGLADVPIYPALIREVYSIYFLYQTHPFRQGCKFGRETPENYPSYSISKKSADKSSAVKSPAYHLGCQLLVLVKYPDFCLSWRSCPGYEGLALTNCLVVNPDLGIPVIGIYPCTCTTAQKQKKNKNW